MKRDKMDKINLKLRIIKIVRLARGKDVPNKEVGDAVYELVEDVEKSFTRTPIKQCHVAVISHDRHDFELWKSKNKLSGDRLEILGAFKTLDTTYYCISNPSHLCSLSIHEIIETEYAKQNKYYKEIMRSAKVNILLQPNENKRNQ